MNAELNRFWNKLLCHIEKKEDYMRLMRICGLRYRSLLRLFRTHIILTNPDHQDYVALINKALNSPFIAIDMLLEQKYKIDYTARGNYNSPVPQLYHILAVTV